MPVLKVSNGLMAVQVPQGDSTIQLEYHTKGLNASLAVSAVCLVVWAVYILLGRRMDTRAANANVFRR